MKSNFFQKLFYNWQIKIICLILAIFAYVVLLYSVQEQRSLALPYDMVLPENYKVESNLPQSIELVIMGTEDQIYLIDASKISLLVDFSTVSKEGVSYADVQIDTSDLSEYIDLSNISIYTRPSQIKVYFSANGGA